MKINYYLTTSERGNQVVKLEIDNTNYQETHYWYSGYRRLQQLENFITQQEIASYRELLRITDKLYSDNRIKLCKSFDKVK